MIDFRQRYAPAPVFDVTIDPCYHDEVEDAMGWLLALRLLADVPGRLILDRAYMHLAWELNWIESATG